MKCSKNSLKCDMKLWSANRNYPKLTRCQTFYAGLIVCLVSFATCSDGRHHLTYENIYNNTKYAQIQHNKPYQTINLSYIKPNKENSIHNSFKDFVGGEVNDVDYDDVSIKQTSVNNSKIKGQLLVGFSYDPYRFSVPEAEYIKGVRSYKPQPPSEMKNERGKRGVAHLYNMIYCATGCEPLSYKGYGCYCGFLGEGKATDGIDRCCKLHDQCYENLYCPFFTVYFQPYYWKCYHGEPLCALENHETRNQLINGCAGQLCECDRKLAMCLRRYRCPRKRALCRSSPLRLLQNILMSKR